MPRRNRSGCNRRPPARLVTAVSQIHPTVIDHGTPPTARGSGAKAVGRVGDAVPFLGACQAVLNTAIELCQVHKSAMHPRVQLSNGPLHNKLTQVEEAGILLVESAVEGAGDEEATGRDACIVDWYVHVSA